MKMILANHLYKKSLIDLLEFYKPVNEGLDGV